MIAFKRQQRGTLRGPTSLGRVCSHRILLALGYSMSWLYEGYLCLGCSGQQGRKTIKLLLQRHLSAGPQALKSPSSTVNRAVSLQGFRRNPIDVASSFAGPRSCLFDGAEMSPKGQRLVISSDQGLRMNNSLRGWNLWPAVELVEEGHKVL